MSFQFKREIQIFLLVLIIIGVGLLLTQKVWVPKLVNYILRNDTEKLFIPMITSTVATSTTATSSKPNLKVPPPVIKPIVVDSGIEGTVTIGPTCPVERFPADPACAPKPYQTTLVISSNLPGRATGILVHTDAQGHFSQTLSPGTYTIRAQSSVVMPRLSPITFQVVAHKQTILNLQFDSGIR